MAGAGDQDSEARLALDDPDMRLPWLEPVEAGENEGLDWSRIGRFAAVVAVIVLVVAGAVWFLGHRVAAPPDADGSIIAAPTEPYKVRPENPGGKRFAGREDTSYLIGEGIEREGRIAEPDMPEPEPDPSPSASATADATPSPTLSGVAVQVGAYANEADAREGWRALTGRYTPLGDYDRRIVEGRADIGTVFRLQAVAANRAAANALCNDLRNNGIECQVKR